MAQGPAVSVVQAEALVACCILPSRFRGALPSVVPLVQLGGVLALHVRHVALRGLLPMENEQLLG